MEVENQIDKLIQARVEDDPRVKDKKRNLSNFQANRDKKKADSEEKTRKLAEADEKQADTMMAGGTPNLRALAQLREAIAEDEAEVRVLDNVITKAKVVCDDVQTKVKMEYVLKNWEAASAALRALNTALQAVSERKAVVEKVFQLPYLSGFHGWGTRDHLRELENVIEQLRKHEGYCVECVETQKAGGSV